MTRKAAHRTYKHILKDADAGILWSYVVEETGVTAEIMFKLNFVIVTL